MWDGLVKLAIFGGLFSFLAVAAWTESRRREREAYYRSEVLKKAMELPGPESAAVLAHLKEQELAEIRRQTREKRRSLLTGGLTTAAAGIGLMIFLRPVVFRGQAVYLVGLIPLLVGLALVAGSSLVKDDPSTS